MLALCAARFAIGLIVTLTLNIAPFVQVPEVGVTL
jgi:hypothetical protein